MLRIRRDIPWLLCGLGVVSLGVLPSATLSGVILACSYDRQVENIGVFVVMLRSLCIGLGMLVFAHSLPSVRRFTFERLLPRPPRPTDASARANPLLEVDGGKMLTMTGFLVFLCLPVLASLAIRPRLLHPLLREDGVYESLQAALFLSGAVILAYASVLAVKHVKPVGTVHVVQFLLSAALLLAGLEEISYGQRLIHFRTPGSLRSLNVQGEFNLHNVATGFTNRAFACLAFAFGFVLPVAAGFSSRLGYALRRLRIRLPGAWGILPFAIAATFVTPGGYRKAVFDEQSVLSYVAIVGVALLLTMGLLRRRSRGRAWTWAVVFGVTVGVKALLGAFDGNWPAGNYAEEMKESLIAFGLFFYAISLCRVGGLEARRRPEKEGSS